MYIVCYSFSMQIIYKLKVCISCHEEDSLMRAGTFSEVTVCEKLINTDSQGLVSVAPFLVGVPSLQYNFVESLSKGFKMRFESTSHSGFGISGGESG